MAFNIQAFKSSFKDGGARPTLYEVQVSFPNVSDSAEITGGDGSLASNKLMFTCLSANLPPSQVSSIEVPYFGRSIKVEGNRTYSDWSVTIFNDESMIVRTSLEAWHAKINSIVPNVMSPDFADGSYKVSAYVRQYAKANSGGSPEGDVIREYEMVGMFPTVIGPIELGWAERDRIETFRVDFALDWWLPFRSNDVATALGTVGNQAIPLV